MTLPVAGFSTGIPAWPLVLAALLLGGGLLDARHLGLLLRF